MQQNLKKKYKKNQQNLNSWAKYSGLAFQMLAIILLGVFGGRKLDNITNLNFPVFTIILIPVSVILAIYYAIKDLIKFK